jgi:hypothetical protein
MHRKTPQLITTTAAKVFFSIGPRSKSFLFSYHLKTEVSWGSNRFIKAEEATKKAPRYSA